MKTPPDWNEDPQKYFEEECQRARTLIELEEELATAERNTKLRGDELEAEFGSIAIIPKS
jgi:hypothetical protein